MTRRQRLRLLTLATVVALPSGMHADGHGDARPEGGAAATTSSGAVTAPSPAPGLGAGLGGNPLLRLPDSFPTQDNQRGGVSRAVWRARCRSDSCRG